MRDFYIRIYIFGIIKRKLVEKEGKYSKKFGLPVWPSSAEDCSLGVRYFLAFKHTLLVMHFWAKLENQNTSLRILTGALAEFRNILPVIRTLVVWCWQPLSKVQPSLVATVARRSSSTPLLRESAERTVDNNDSMKETVLMLSVHWIILHVSMG